jgi:ZIP family zinc transporter
MEAFLWGLFAGSSVLLGALATFIRPISPRPLGLVMAFGSGVLISAVAYELVGEAFRTSHGADTIAFGLMTGAIVFVAGDYIIDARGGLHRKRSHGGQRDGSGLAITLGIILDGIPESIVIGLSLVGGASPSVAVIAAVFISNVPEGIGATSGLLKAGWSRWRVTGLWTAVASVSALASLAGFGLFDHASDTTVAFVLSFAGGAVLTMLADTMIPEAFELGGKLVGLATTFGFAAAFALSSLS